MRWPLGCFFGMLLLIIGCTCGAAGAAALPPAIFGPNFGLNIKTERITPAELDEIAALGIRRVRISIPWYRAEHQAGNYDWDYPVPRDEAADDSDTIPTISYNQILAQIMARGLHADITLHESNGLYTGREVAVADDPAARRLAAPRTPEERAAFARFAAATAKHFTDLYGSSRLTWLIWNEPDRDGSFAPKADGIVFGQLLEESCRAIRAAVPDSTIMGPALSAWGEGDIPYDFITAMFARANPLGCLDAFTIHPYRAGRPETTPADYKILRQRLQAWQPAGRDVPIAVDEWGVSTASLAEGQTRPEAERWRDFSEREQAALILRFYLMNLAEGIPLTVLYDWRDRATDPYEREDHFGVVGFHHEAKPALMMFRVVWPILNDRPLLGHVRGKGCDAAVHGLRFGMRPASPGPVADPHAWLVLWSEDVPRSVEVRGAFDQVQDSFGTAIPVDTSQVGLTRVTLSGVPLLVRLPGGEFNGALSCKTRSVPS